MPRRVEYRQGVIRATFMTSRVEDSARSTRHTGMTCTRAWAISTSRQQAIRLTLTLCASIHATSQTAPKGATTMSADPRPLRIVLADDHPIFLIGLTVVIEQGSRAKVIAQASAPDELLDKLRSEPCDLLITDFMMPVQDQNDGLRLLERIRREHPDLPIIVVTMLNNAGLFKSMLDMNIQGLLSKASMADELPLAITNVAAGKAFIADSVKRSLLQAVDYGSDTLRALEDLSPKELEVIRLLAAGHSVGEIAANLNRSKQTVSAQKVSAMRKLGQANDAALFIYLQEHGLV
jgi:two-component system capsular synthesis response regulator RcsB